MTYGPTYNWHGSLPKEARLRAEVMQEITAERFAQIKRGYDSTHDDQHTRGEIITAAWGAQARLARTNEATTQAERRALLVQVAAQIVAEIERIDRTGGS